MKSKNKLEGVYDNKFTKAMFFILRKNILVDPNDEELGETVMNTILGKDGLRVKKSANPTKEQQLLGQLLHGWSEIHSSLKNLYFITVYLEQYPNYKKYKLAGITPAVYFRYHYENYLNELYILKTRLIAYLNLIKKRNENLRLKKDIQKVLTVVEESLLGPVKVRARHVHERRYTDRYIETLEIQELMLRSKSNKFFKDQIKIINKSSMIELKYNWVNSIKKNQAALFDLVKWYFDEVHQFVFNKKNELLISPKAN